MSTLGSIKRKSKLPKPKFSAKGTCLFAPEGTLDEVRMARFAIDTAKAHPSNEFTLRLHPLMNPVEVRSMLEASSALPSNFILSTNSLDFDLAAKPSWICYRGSTVAFQVF